METLNQQRERICTPRGNLFELIYDPGKMCYYVDGPIIGGNVIPLQGARIRVESQELDRMKATDDLVKLLAEKGY